MGPALLRYGAMLAWPRQAVALPPGRHDALVLVIAYVVACQLGTLGEAVARVAAGIDEAPLLALGAVGRALVAPLVALLGCEWILGTGRVRQAPACLVPLVAFRAVWGAVDGPGPDAWIDGVGVALALSWALRLRAASEEAPAP